MVFAHTTPWKWLYFFLKGLNRPENLTEKKIQLLKNLLLTFWFDALPEGQWIKTWQKHQYLVSALIRKLNEASKHKGLLRLTDKSDLATTADV